MNRQNFKAWLRAALIRAVRTVAQTAVALIGTNAVGVTDVDWIAVASAAVLAGIVSVLTSIAGIPEVPNVQVHDLTSTN